MRQLPLQLRLWFRLNESRSRIAGRLGLRYIDGQTRYRLGPELSCTFAEYAALYVKGSDVKAFPSRGRSAVPFAARMLDLPDVPAALGPLVAERLAEAERLLLLGKPSEAACEASLLCRDQPDSAPAHETLAEARRRSDDRHGATEAAQTAIALVPHLGSQWRLLGQALEASGDAAGAEAALRHDPLSPDARNLLAELLDQRAELRHAVAVLQQGLAMEIWNTRTFWLLGDFHLRGGELGKAEEAFMLGLQVEPHHESLRGRLDAVRQTRRDAVRV